MIETILDFIKPPLLKLLQSPTTWGVIVCWVFILIHYIVYKTKTKRDDKIWHAISGMITMAFDVAEKGIPDKKGRLNKLDKALKIFNEEYRKRKGKAPDENLINYAKDHWALMAHSFKKK